MEVIRHITSRRRFSRPVISLGNFDGVHLGHQAILAKAINEARAIQGTALVLTFHPHPLTILRPQNPLPLISSLREKLLLLRSLKVDGVILQPFSSAFAQLTAEEFVQRYLVNTVGVERVVVGHNVSFGHRRSGNAETLVALGKQFGFAVDVVGPVLIDGKGVSSTGIRTLLGTASMREVTSLLGRAYAVSGRVEKGFQRGRTIGFPTANLRPRADLLLPNGVYAVTIDVDEKTTVPGVANVGMNPTFGNKRRTIEAHLFDFSADLYGKRLRVSFVEHIREERKFPSVPELIRQIQEDANRARALLAGQ
ncbi:MAG: bifunctional riboflavin kinase/FAD synthetase [Deltaproteobacteria bacterium]|nr:bifunctional riboflavin kinase/FAD synthetase [Deltaproteobacteria bacterium]